MISVLVSYRVKPEFAAQNTNNIQQFLQDFAQLPPEDFQYTVYTKEDGVSFLHHSLYKNEAIQNQVLKTPSFLHFQQQRDASGLDGTHKVEVLQFVGASKKLL